MVAIRFPVRHFLVECDLVCDHEVVAGVDGGCPVACFGADWHYSVDDYEVDFVVVKSLLLVYGGKWI